PPSNHPRSSSSVQLQLVIKSLPPLFISGSTLSLYPSHVLRPCASVSCDRQTASNVPLSRTTSKPDASHGPGGCVRMSHSWKAMLAYEEAASLASRIEVASVMLCGE